jgi:hypothetical protein
VVARRCARRLRLVSRKERLEYRSIQGEATPGSDIADEKKFSRKYRL